MGREGSCIGKGRGWVREGLGLGSEALTVRGRVMGGPSTGREWEGTEGG